MEMPAPHGSTQTPIDARYKREGGGGEHAATSTTTTASADADESAPPSAAAPQPQDVEPQDAEQVQRELRELTREISTHLPTQPEVLQREEHDTEQETKKKTTAAAAGEETKAAEEERQVFSDQHEGAADAGAAAVELAERAVEGVLSAAARGLGLGKKEA